MTKDLRSMGMHLLAYLTAVLFLAIVAIAAHTSGHRGTPSLHTLMEAIAAVFALVVGAIAIVRYQSRRDLPYLFIGTGFMGAAFFDAFHAWSSSVYAYNLFPSDLTSLTLWGWTAGRIYLGAMLVLSGWAWWWGEEEADGRPAIRAHEVYLVSAILAVGVIGLFFFAELPPGVYPGWPIQRPHELVAGLLFLAALIGFFAMGRWRAEPAEHWLVMSLIVALGVQVVFAPFSTALWDAFYDLGHILKITSYALALVGLLLNVHSLHHTVVREEKRLSEVNRLLEDEIVARSAAESRAAQETTLLRSIFDSLGDGILVADADGHMTRCNRAATQLTGRPMTDLPPEQWARYYGFYQPDEHTPLPPEDVPLVRAMRGEAFDSRNVYVENRGLEDGIHLSVSGRPVRGPNGEPRGGVVVLRDVTTDHQIQEQLRRYTAELERRNQDLEDFATIVSHDLKEPLRKVLAFGERLESKLGPDIPADAADHLRRMRQAADRMRSLIDDLLAYTRLNELQTVQEVELETVVQRAVSDLDERIEETGGTVEVERLCRVSCDPLQMYQVFANLIGNALKYHHPHVAPRVRIYGTVDGPTCTITVEDNGIGFDMKYAERIFRPFHRLHTRSQYEGSGIGLAIVRKIIEQHGGAVSVDSIPDKGTRFILLLPIEQNQLEVNANAA